MSVLDINPDYTALLQRAGLERAHDFLQISGVVICGHPDRNVSRVRLGSGTDALECFLKKEHRVRWTDRCRNAWAGFGLVSKSRREMAMFRMLRQGGIECPEVVAAGEHGGQAFALLRAANAALDLRSYLEQTSHRHDRRRLAERLGASLARIHAAGFDQPDLYSKHILVEQGQRFWFLDWQRSRRRSHLTWSQRCRDLAALDATLTGQLAGASERLACLRSYLQASDMSLLCRAGIFSLLARRVRACAMRLLERRYVRELRHAPLRVTEQRLIWVDGEAVCVTPEFRTESKGDMSAWLEVLRQPAEHASEYQSLRLSGGREARLARRRESRPWQWLWSKLRGSRPTSRELEQAATLFRLQRYGISSPRVLAVGQRPKPWGSESFLLTEPLPDAVDLADWLDEPGRARQRHVVLRQAGVLVRRLHQAGYRLDALINPRTLCGLVDRHERPQVVLTSVTGLRRTRKHLLCLAGRDLRKLHECFARSCSRTDLLRFALAYLDRPRRDARTWALFGRTRAVRVLEERS